jgi:molybdopterin converting factor small subunit
MKITVEMTKALANEAGFKEIDIDLPGKDTLGLEEALSELVKKSSKMKDLLYETDGTLNYHIMIFINDKPLQSSDEDSVRIKDGDTIHIYPIIGGG